MSKVDDELRKALEYARQGVIHAEQGFPADVSAQAFCVAFACINVAISELQYSLARSRLVEFLATIAGGMLGFFIYDVFFR